GVLRLRSGALAAELPQLGETVWLVPGHCDPTVNLHDRFIAVRGGLIAGRVEAVWAIEARGCTS
ncbi:MAG: DSD1 family PLP-dependent enzyme, partial [Caldimonas sp.]